MLSSILIPFWISKGLLTRIVRNNYERRKLIGGEDNERVIERYTLQITSLNTVININEKINQSFNTEINNHSGEGIVDTHLDYSSNISIDCNNRTNPITTKNVPTGDFLNKNQVMTFQNIM